eukprot:gene10905-30944_t
MVQHFLNAVALAALLAPTLTAAFGGEADYYRIDGDECSQCELGYTLGFCPISIVLSQGGLSKGRCDAQGFNVDAGKSDQAAGPCGTIHFTLFKRTAGRQMRDLGGAATASGIIVFGGGCVGGSSVFTCEEPSGNIDLFQNGAPVASSSVLTYARGWPATCAAGEKVAFLGGGTSGSRAHKPVLDVLDLSNLQEPTVRGNATAMDAGRWGTSCTLYRPNNPTQANRGQLIFGGGKIVTRWGGFKMTDEVLILDESMPIDGLTLASYKLSVARESTGAVSMPGLGIMFAGGWISAHEPGTPSGLVDTFTFGSSTADRWSSWNMQPPKPNQYWVGVSQWNETTMFVADSTTLYIVSADTFAADARPVEVPLPAAVASAQGIPSARLAQNGVKVGDTMVCFYSAAPNGLVCYAPATGAFSMHPCTAGHTAGAIASANSTVYVAGGVASDGTTLTDVIDVFTF